MRSRLEVKVVPKASREGLVGWLGDALKVRVTAPPEKGRANEAVRDVLAEVLGVPPDRVRLVAGQAAARKVFEVEGVDERELRRRIEAALAG
jgi:uncharacterized protein (TIGR00251 family)